ncbi:TPA: glycosyltransferase, partial [Candidatus Woesearchaeota archaeon]|nr:glycosyltransferase [Candidatus Woesearchaeota archaeon]
MRVSCIIPAYNEESTLGKVLRVVKKVRTIHEIIVVDDGSSDKTYAVAKAEDVRVIR